jgi:hypothetical protein
MLTYLQQNFQYVSLIWPSNCKKFPTNFFVIFFPEGGQMVETLSKCVVCQKSFITDIAVLFW